MTIADIINEFRIGYIGELSLSQIIDIHKPKVGVEKDRLDKIIVHLNVAYKKVAERFGINKDIITVRSTNSSITLPANTLSIDGIYSSDGRQIPLDTMSMGYSVSVDNKISRDSPAGSPDGIYFSQLTALQVSPFIIKFIGGNSNTDDVFIHYTYTKEKVFNADKTSILEFPNMMLSCLYTYANYLSRQDNNILESTAGNIFYLRYEAECKRIELKYKKTLPVNMDYTISKSGLIL